MEKKDKEDAEKEELANIFSQISKDKKTTVAKDLVELKHVETKKQEVSQDTLNLAQTLKGKILEHDQFEELSNDELTILESFMGKRCRIPMGIPGFKKAELEELLDGLCKKGYLESDQVGDNLVFFLSERGKYRVQ
jgi:hypothetical protein